MEPAQPDHTYDQSSNENVIITTEDIVSAVAAHEQAEGRRLSCELRKVSAAMAILIEFFGKKWFKKHIDPSPQIRQRGTFIHPPQINDFDKNKMPDRTVALAEHLFNLQETENFDLCLKEIRGGDLESTMAKLVAAGMLKRRGVPFRFVTTSGCRPFDYDAEALIGASRVPVEMKAKVEGNEPSAQSIVNTLRTVRKQIPKDTANLVFLRVPQEWGQTPSGFMTVLEGAHEGLRNTRRITVLVVHWERWSRELDPRYLGWARRRERLMVIPHPNPYVDLEALEAAITTKPAASQPIDWVDFDALLCERAPVVDRGTAGTAAPQFDPTDLMFVGPVVLKHAHFCRSFQTDSDGLTCSGIRQIVSISGGRPDRFPMGSKLVLHSEAYLRREQTMDLKVLLHKAGRDTGSVIFQTDLQFVRVERGKPLIGQVWFDLSDVEIYGPGIYTMDFIAGIQFIGRLPLLVYSDEMPTGAIDRKPFGGDFVSLEYGHIARGLEPPALSDPERAVSYTGITSGLVVEKDGPSVWNPSVLMVALSSSDNVPPQHTVALQIHDVTRKSQMVEVSGEVTFQPRLPGELYFIQALNLGERMVYPSVGDYRFVVLVDGKKVGVVELPVRVEQPLPS